MTRAGESSRARGQRQRIRGSLRMRGFAIARPAGHPQREEATLPRVADADLVRDGPVTIGSFNNDHDGPLGCDHDRNLGVRSVLSSVRDLGMVTCRNNGLTTDAPRDEVPARLLTVGSTSGTQVPCASPWLSPQ